MSVPELRLRLRTFTNELDKKKCVTKPDKCRSPNCTSITLFSVSLQIVKTQTKSFVCVKKFNNHKTNENITKTSQLAN